MTLPVFISYAHEDRDFAAELAMQLVRHRTHVWIDEWELRVGDSITERIEGAITDASALIVVLSEASVVSAWCRRELSAGLIRELEERRVVVLPVLLTDCEIPLFLRDKLYADFRTSFDDGLQRVLQTVACVTSQSLGRVETPEWHVDWAMDWDLRSGRLELTFTLIDQAVDEPFCCLTEMKVVGNNHATKRYTAFAEEGLDWFQQGVILELLAESATGAELRVLLEGSVPVQQGIECRSGDLVLEVLITARRAGADTGRDVLIDLGDQIRRVRDAHRSAVRPLTAEEQATVLRLRDRLGPAS